MSSGRRLSVIDLVSGPNEQSPLIRTRTLSTSGNRPFKLPSRVGSVSAGGRRASFLPLIESYTSNLNRADVLHELRPFRLIGLSRSLRDWDKLKKSDDELNEAPKKLRNFYDNQNELIERYLSIDRLLDSGIQINMLKVYDSISHNSNNSRTNQVPGNVDQESSSFIPNSQEDSQTVYIAIMINFAINIFLLGGKGVTAFLTSSMSIIASLVDSFLDFLSTFIIWGSNQLVEHRNWSSRNKYPVGKKRLEPIGVLVFSIIIIISFVQVASQSVQRLIDGTREAVAVGFSATLIMIVTIVVKLICYVWCRSINSSSIQALAQDALTDVVFNTFSILIPLVGHHFNIWWFDPFGALALSIYIIISWGQTAFQHIENLTGARADQEDIQMILYLAMRFSDSIKEISILNVYHVGDGLNVEMDVVFDEKLVLKDAHDLAETLQYAIETLPMVERAFVHLDYRPDNFTGHVPQ